MASMRQVYDALGGAISTAYNGAGITPATALKVFPGWPNQDDLTQIVKAKQQQISLYALPGLRTVKEWIQPNASIVNAPAAPTLTATIAGNTITFGGTAQGGLNLHTIVKKGGVLSQYDALYQTQNTDTLATTAAAVAASINAASVPGVTASAVGAVVTLTGLFARLKVNIGQSSVTMNQIARRLGRRIQVSVWSWSPDVRDATVDVILNQVANKRNPWLQAADGSWIKFDVADDLPNDDMGMETQFIHHTIFTAEYTMFQPVSATQVGVTEMTITPTNGPGVAPSITIVDGG